MSVYSEKLIVGKIFCIKLFRDLFLNLFHTGWTSSYLCIHCLEQKIKMVSVVASSKTRTGR